MKKYFLSVLAVCIFSFTQVQAQSASASLSLSSTDRGTVYLSIFLNNSPSWVSDYQIRFSLPSYITPASNSVTWYRLSENHTYRRVNRNSATVNTNYTGYTVIAYADRFTPVSNTSDELLRIPLTVDWDNAPADIEQTISIWEFIISGMTDGKQIEATVPDASINFTISPTGITGPAGTPSIQVYVQNRNLYVDSPVAERISVYSVTGVLLYDFDKQAGVASTASASSATGFASTASVASTGSATGILIVKGSSGWVKKVIN